MKVITVNKDKCTGCRLCELACSLKNTGECNPTRAMIHVIGFDELYSLPLMCFQCEKPYCEKICPTNAIVRNKETGVVRVIGERCIGCKLCQTVCPFGNIAYSSEKGVAVKCELCGGEPECVTFCPTGALEFREADAAMIRRKSALSEKIRGIYEEL